MSRLVSPCCLIALVGIIWCTGPRVLASDQGATQGTPAAGCPSDTAVALAQAQPHAGSGLWLRTVTGLPEDWAEAGREVVRPASLPVLGAVAVMTGGLIVADHALYDRSRAYYDHSPFLRSASEVAVHLGDGKVHLAVAGLFGGYGFLAKDERALRTGRQVVESLLATGIAVQVLKRISGRESPQASTGRCGKWRPFPSLKQYQQHQPRYYAFPSGHIATTAATLTVIAENYPEAGWLTPLSYGVIGCVGVSLVNVRYHWYSDLPLGVGLGYLLGKVIASRPASSDSHKAQASTHIMLIPSPGPGASSMTFAMEF